MRALGSNTTMFLIAVTAAGPAWAGTPVATPGPLIGAGAPALVGLAYLYKRIRKSRGE